MSAAQPALGAPFTAEQVAQGIRVGAAPFSYDELMSRLESPDFFYKDGRFQPRPGLQEENVHRYEQLGKEAYFAQSYAKKPRVSQFIIQKSFLGPKQVPVLFVYILGVKFSPENVLPEGLSQGLPVKYGRQSIRVYLGHDEWRLTKRPISNTAVADSKTIGELQFTLANDLDKNVHIGWLGSSKREAGVATELTRRLIDLFQNPLSGICTLSMAATHPASVKIGKRFGFLEMPRAEAETFWTSRKLPEDTDHMLEIRSGIADL